MENKPSSAGKTAAIAGVTATQFVILLMWACQHFGIPDMTIDVATAIVSIATAMAGGLMHLNQRHSEKKEKESNAQTNGVTGGPGA